MFIDGPHPCRPPLHPLPPCQVVNQRMAKLKPQGSAAHRRPAAEVILKYDLGGRRAIVCDGHLDEVVELRRGGQKMQGEG